MLLFFGLAKDTQLQVHIILAMVIRVGIPRERKDQEGRVVLDPSSVAVLLEAGHGVVVEATAGGGAGFSDDEYRAAGAEIVGDPAAVWAADVVVKVKEPQPEEYNHFRPGLILFAFLHLAAEPDLAVALSDVGVEAYAFETLRDPTGTLPILTPMSDIAGRAAAIIAASSLAGPAGGRGVLAGGTAGVAPAKAVVIGMGTAGSSAARGLRGLDAHVTGVDVNLERLYQVQREGIVHATLSPSPAALCAALSEADIVIGAALVTGRRAPVVVEENMVRLMPPGAVILDIAIDQGGCVATSQPTVLSAPTYKWNDVLHYCVTNIPGQFPRTASQALSVAVIPHLMRLLDSPRGADLDGARNVSRGQIVHPSVAAALS